MYGAGELIAIFIALVIYFGLIGLGITNYIMTALALHTIAKRRQIKHPWLGWIPVGCEWLIGCLADDYEAQNGMKRKWRTVLITLEIIVIAVIFVVYVIFIVSIITAVMEYNGTSAVDPYPAEILGAVIVLYIGLIVAMIAAMALEICVAICYLKIYESTVPEKAVKYLLLSILVPFASAVCLTKCKDKGYSKPYPLEMTFMNNGVLPTEEALKKNEPSDE